MAIGLPPGHTAWIMDRGGQRRIAQVHDLNLTRYNRARDEISEADIRLTTEKAEPQVKILNEIDPGRHELCIYRGADRMWEGPINRAAWTASGFEVHAYDVLQYVNRTAIHAAYSSAYPNIEKVVERIRRIMVAELARKEACDPPYNIVPFITDHQFTTDAETSAVTEPYQMLLFSHLDDLAQKSGIDYTVIGRAIHLWDVSRPVFGQTQTVTEADFLGDVKVTMYGAELATRTIVTDGQGAYGIDGGIDPYYGEWEMLADAYDEKTDDGPAPSVAELTSQAVRNRKGRLPTPMQVRVPDGSAINPHGVLELKDLVPGVYMNMRATLNLREVKQMQKLNHVRFEETPAGETISITLFPATQADDVGVPI